MHALLASASSATKPHTGMQMRTGAPVASRDEVLSQLAALAAEVLGSAVLPDTPLMEVSLL